MRVLHGGADKRVPRAVAGACSHALLTDLGPNVGHFELIDPESGAPFDAILTALREMSAA
jgi:hypothetical protein